MGDHPAMPPLGAKERAQLPDSAFAYIDRGGRRRLPIHDAAHVRNALARFSQVAFEDEAARDRARSRLLRAAKKHGIMPIGFISAQLQPQRKLPTGPVTFLLTDHRGLDRAARASRRSICALLADVRRRVRAAVRQAGGREVVRARRRRLRRVRAAPPRRSTPRWPSSGRCAPAIGPEETTCGCGSVCTAGVPRSPTPATSASRFTPPRASASRRTAARSSCLQPFARRSPTRSRKASA